MIIRIIKFVTGSFSYVSNFLSHLLIIEGTPFNTGQRKLWIWKVVHIVKIGPLEGGIRESLKFMPFT